MSCLTDGKEVTLPFSHIWTQEAKTSYHKSLSPLQPLSLMDDWLCPCDKTQRGASSCSKLGALQPQFLWTSNPSAANINKVERLTDKEELCRKPVAELCFFVVYGRPLSPLTPWPLSEIMQCHCHRGHSPASSLWPMTAHGGGLHLHVGWGECARVIRAATVGRFEKCTFAVWEDDKPSVEVLLHER